MDRVKMSLALSHYDRHIPFFDGSVVPEGIELTALQVGQTVPLKHGGARHERMLQQREFDICELSLSSYLIARSRGLPFTAIPVFPRRLFSQSQMWINAGAGIRSAKDLIERKVGLNTFQTTLSVLAKGDLQTEYAVPWRHIHWLVAKDETLAVQPQPGVSIRTLHAGQKMGEMLERGEIDALMVPHPPPSITRGSDRVRRLFADAKQEEIRYFRKNGFYPIMHVITFKDEVLEKHAWAATSVMEAFATADELSKDYYNDPNWSRLAWTRHLFEEERTILGDAWPSGISRNRANLERFMSYSLDQGLMERPMTVEELFAESTRDT